LHWESFGDGPIIEADPTWYELLDLKAWHQQAWPPVLLAYVATMKVVAP
jgi:hypothetical protein